MASTENSVILKKNHVAQVSPEETIVTMKMIFIKMTNIW